MPFLGAIFKRKNQNTGLDETASKNKVQVIEQEKQLQEKQLQEKQLQEKQEPPSIVQQRKVEGLREEPSLQNKEEYVIPEEEEVYPVVEREIHPAKIICPDCGGITLEGLDFCDKCGGELL